MEAEAVSDGVRSGAGDQGHQSEPRWRLSSAFRRSPCLGGVELLRAAVSGGCYAMHSHDEYTIALMDEGSCAFECGASRWALGPRTVLVIPPGVPHTGGASDSLVRYRVLYVPGSAMREACGPSGAGPRCGIFENPTLFARLSALHDALMETSNGMHHAAELGATLAMLPRGVPEERGADHEPRRVRVVREHLESNLGGSASLDELSDLAGVSPFYLQRTFKRATRMSPREFLMDLRIRRARTLLREGLAPRRVAAEVGFFDQSHFTRAFRRLTGATPGQFAIGDGSESGR